MIFQFPGLNDLRLRRQLSVRLESSSEEEVQAPVEEIQVKKNVFFSNPKSPNTSLEGVLG